MPSVIRLVLGAMLVCSWAVRSAHAQPPRSLEDYMAIAGETAAGRLECGFALDTKRLQEIGRPFQLQSTDEAAVSLVADGVAASIAQALSTIRAEGREQACPRLLALYGPNGGRAAGLLTRPAGN